MKKLTLLLLSVLYTAATTFASDFKSGDLFYNITGENSVAVTYQVERGSNNYQGLTTTSIPATVTYNGTTYSVPRQPNPTRNPPLTASRLWLPT